jgi:hypothetical protein
MHVYLCSVNPSAMTRSIFKGRRFRECAPLRRAENDEKRVDDHAGHTANVQHSEKLNPTSAKLKQKVGNTNSLSMRTVPLKNCKQLLPN